MRLTVRLFGNEAAEVGQDSIEVEAATGTQARHLLERIAEQWPALLTLLASARLAVNHTIAKPDQVLAEGDEIALIGMVSGG